MKKIIVLTLTLACILGLIGCNENERMKQEYETENKRTVSQDVPEPESYAFDAQYIRTDGYSEENGYPYYIVIDSKEELEVYYEENKERFDLERKEVVYSDTTKGFLDACDKYSNAYFEDNNLVLIVLQEGSGSIRHKIIDVRVHRDENGVALGWDITIERVIPEVGTDDMAQWHLFLEVQMGNVINDGDSIWINGEIIKTKDNGLMPI